MLKVSRFNHRSHKSPADHSPVAVGRTVAEPGALVWEGPREEQAWGFPGLSPPPAHSVTLTKSPYSPENVREGSPSILPDLNAATPKTIILLSHG